MGSFSMWHWIVVGTLVLLLFGRGRFSALMSDVAGGIKSFKREMADEPLSAALPQAEAADLQRDRSSTPGA